MSVSQANHRFVAPAHPRVVPVPAFRDNYLWLVLPPEGGRAAAVVDPGDAAPIEAALEARGLTLAAILLTHHHPDHAGGVARLVQRFGCPVFGPRAEAIAGVDHPLDDGDTGSVPAVELRFEVLSVPGHTRGHIAYQCAPLGGDPRPVLFCGDTLFAAGCGRLFEGTAPQMHASLSRLAALPDSTLVYCAHEYTESNLRFARAVTPDDAEVAARAAEAARMRVTGTPTVPSTIAIERATNPFLRWDDAQVAHAAAERLGRVPVTPVEVFATVRAWKDVFA